MTFKPLTRAQRRARKPGETTGRKPLPPEQRRVQRTVSLDHDDDYHLQALAMERGQSVPQVIEGIVAVHLSTVIGGEK